MCFTGSYATAKNFSVVAFTVSGLIVMVTLLALSIQNVEQDEWALNYGKVTRHVRGDVMGPGRVTIQPDSRLIRYKNTFVPYDILVDCWTTDGLEVVLDIAIQTRYISNEIEQIFFEFGDEEYFKRYVVEILQELLRDSCSNFTSFDYYNKRGEIQANMLTKIDTLLPTLGTHITSGGYLQLRNIQLPPLFNQAITDKRSAEQDISVSQNQRAQQLIIANTALSQAINQGTININNARQQADATLFDAAQQAAAISAKYQRRLEVYQSAMNNLGLNASDYIRNILVNGLIEANGETQIFM